MGSIHSFVKINSSYNNVKKYCKSKRKDKINIYTENQYGDNINHSENKKKIKGFIYKDNVLNIS